MKIYLDTDQMEDIQLTLTEDDYERNINEVILDYCLGMAGIFGRFALKFECDNQKIKDFKKACLSITEDYIDKMIEDGVLDKNHDN